MSLTKRRLGKTDLEISCLGFGTVKIGRNQEVKYPNGFSLPSDEEVSALIDQAKELGINLIDTAPPMAAASNA